MHEVGRREQVRLNVDVGHVFEVYSVELNSYVIVEIRWNSTLPVVGTVATVDHVSDPQRLQDVKIGRHRPVQRTTCGL